MFADPSHNDHDDYRIEWHGDAIVLVPSGSVESLRWELVDHAASVVFGPLQELKVPLLVVDLRQVAYCGSVFLAMLLKLHKLVRSRGGELVLCNANPFVEEILQVTALNTIWAIYDSREEALGALGA